MNINPVYINPTHTDYDLVDWDMSEPRLVTSVMSVYATKGRIQSWANGYKNYQHWLGVL